jgi:hypothetical protein
MTEASPPGPTSPQVNHDFDFLHGTWTVGHRYLVHRLVGADEWDEFEGTAGCTPILGGLGNIDEFRTPARGTLGGTVRLFDRASRRWSLHWASTATGRFEPPVVGSFEDGTGVFEGEDTYQGTRISVRYVWDEIGPTHARWRQSFSNDAGTTWELNWTMTFTRSASDPSPVRPHPGG